MKTILITNNYSDSVLDIVTSLVPEGFTVKVLEENTSECLMKNISLADYLLASGRLKINRELLKKAKKLRMIQRTGVGLDSIDLSALKDANIPLYVNSGVNAVSVAEHTVMLILASLRKLTNLNNNIRKGIWDKQKQGIKNRELCGKTVGLVGFGNIGQTVAKQLAAFSVDILYYDQNVTSTDLDAVTGAKSVSLNSLLEKSDIISLHCPLNKETYHMINKKSISLMKDDVIVINTARGNLIDENDLSEALLSGKIAFAGIDVFNDELAIENSPLLELTNTILTPHVAGITYDSFSRMIKEAFYNISQFDKHNYQEIEDKKYVMR